MFRSRPAAQRDMRKFDRFLGQLAKAPLYRSLPGSKAFALPRNAVTRSRRDCSSVRRSRHTWTVFFAGALGNPRDAILALPLANFLDAILRCDLGNFLDGIFFLAVENFLEGIFVMAVT